MSFNYSNQMWKLELPSGCLKLSLSVQFVHFREHRYAWNRLRQQIKAWWSKHTFLKQSMHPHQQTEQQEPKLSIPGRNNFRVGGQNWVFIKEVHSLGFILCQNCFDRGCVYLAQAPSCLPLQLHSDLINLHGCRDRGIIWDIVVVIFIQLLWESTVRAVSRDTIKHKTTNMSLTFSKFIGSVKSIPTLWIKVQRTWGLLTVKQAVLGCFLHLLELQILSQWEKMYL